MGEGLALLADPALAGLLARLGDDHPDGLQVIRSDRLVARPFDPGMALLVLPAASAGTQAAPAGQVPPAVQVAPAVLPGRHGHGPDPVTLLRRLYPSDHPVLGASGDLRVGTLGRADLEAEPLLLPPLEGTANAASPHGLAWLVDRLRQPDGCPWDREQDHLSLRPFLLEEAYEVYDALEGGSTPRLADELGDLLLQVVLHAQYAAEAGVFDLADVQRAVMTKIVRRHPHVFGDVEADTAADVLRNWEQLKAAERAGQVPEEGTPALPADMPAAFAGLSRSLPALAYASEMQGRAASLGYDWPDLEGVIDKIAEEASELLGAHDEAHRREEFGDLLFVIVNLGRKLGLDAEGALRGASRKFASRFARVERLADSRELELRALGLDALDELWQEAKLEEGA
jgi:MazG family protein